MRKHKGSRERGEGRPGTSLSKGYIRYDNSGYRVDLFKRQRVAGTTVPLLGSLQHCQRIQTHRSVARNRTVVYEEHSSHGMPDTGQGGGGGTRYGVSAFTRDVVQRSQVSEVLSCSPLNSEGLTLVSY